MKKLFLLLTVAALAGCASTAAKNQAPGICTINGNDCWQVAQLLNKTKEIKLETKQPKGEGAWENNVKYENPDLAARGLTVTQHTRYRDGGSTIYVINDQAAFFTNRRIGANKELGYTTVTFKDTDQKFVFDTKGKRVR